MPRDDAARVLEAGPGATGHRRGLRCRPPCRQGPGGSRFRGGGRRLRDAWRFRAESRCRGLGLLLGHDGWSGLGRCGFDRHRLCDGGLGCGGALRRRRKLDVDRRLDGRFGRLGRLEGQSSLAGDVVEQQRGAIAGAGRQRGTGEEAHRDRERAGHAPRQTAVPAAAHGPAHCRSRGPRHGRGTRRRCLLDGVEDSLEPGRGTAATRREREPGDHQHDEAEGAASGTGSTRHLRTPLSAAGLPPPALPLHRSPAPGRCDAIEGTCLRIPHSAHPNERTSPRITSERDVRTAGSGRSLRPARPQDALGENELRNLQAKSRHRFRHTEATVSVLVREQKDSSAPPGAPECDEGR